MPRKRKASQKKKKSRNVGRPRARGGVSSAAMRFVMDVCSVTNPFCPESIAARWPDNSYTKSAGWSATAIPNGFSTDASGNASNLYLPDGQGSTASVSGTTATHTAFGALFTQPSGTARYRVTTWGLKLTTSLSRYTAAGMVRVRLFSPIGGASLASISTTSTMADAIMDIPLSRLVGKDLFIVPAPLGDNARLFRDTTPVTTIANWVNPGWQVVSVSVTGGPISTAGVLEAQMFYNYEYVFADGDAQNAFAEPPPSNNVAVQNASASTLSSVGNFIEDTAGKVDSFFNSKTFKLLSNGAQFGAALYSRNPLAITASGAQLIRDVD